MVLPGIIPNMSDSKIIFSVQESPEGGYEARARLGLERAKLAQSYSENKFIFRKVEDKP
jgi:hypothetical protein